MPPKPQNRWFTQLRTWMVGTEKEPVPRLRAGQSPDGSTLFDRLLEALPTCGPVWCDGVPYEDDPYVLRHRLFQQIQVLSHGFQTVPVIQGFFTQLRSALRQQDLSLPPFPGVGLELFELLEDPDAPINQICDVLKRDPALVQQVWEKASSSRFATPPRDLRYAIARLGVRQLWELSIQSTVNGQVRQVPVMKQEARALWQRSLVTAEVVYTIGAEPCREAVLGALLHEVGGLYLMRFVSQRDKDLQLILPQLIRQINAPLSLLILQTWKFPRPVGLGVGCQGSPETAPWEVGEMSRRIRWSSLAAHIAETMNQGLNCGGLEEMHQLNAEHLGSPSRSIQHAQSCYALLQHEATTRRSGPGRTMNRTRRRSARGRGGGV